MLIANKSLLDPIKQDAGLNLDESKTTILQKSVGKIIVLN